MSPGAPPSPHPNSNYPCLLQQASRNNWNLNSDKTAWCRCQAIERTWLWPVCRCLIAYQYAHLVFLDSLVRIRGITTTPKFKMAPPTLENQQFMAKNGYSYFEG